jgi:hypothetical protein
MRRTRPPEIDMPENVLRDIEEDIADKVSGACRPC